MTDILKEYQTVELTLAAVLIQMGAKLARVLPVEERGRTRCIFVLSDVPREWLNAYDQRHCSLEPVAFHAAIKHLSAVAKRAMAPFKR